MKYLIRTDLNKVNVTTSTGNKKTYVSQAFKRDKTDLNFMELFDLQKWYIEEYLGVQVYEDDDMSGRDKQKALIDYIEKNKELKNRDLMEAAYLENGENSISYGAWKISKEYFDKLSAIYKGDKRVSITTEASDKDVYVMNSEVGFLYGLDRSGLDYEIIN